MVRNAMDGDGVGAAVGMFTAVAQGAEVMRATGLAHKQAVDSRRFANNWDDG